jgi:UDP-galactopyranose mutase
LPASILKRLPLRFNYNDNYYSTRHQAIPTEGYSSIIERMLDHPGIHLTLNSRWDPVMAGEFDHIFYSGALDELFASSHGRLGYRTIHFERIDAQGDFQGNAVINYTSEKVAWTRIHEHKHFAPWEQLDRTVAFREFSKETEPTDVPYYPKRLAGDMSVLRNYEQELAQFPNLTPIGRLGTYRYLDMDQVIGEALDLADDVIAAHRHATAIPQKIRQRSK